MKRVISSLEHILHENAEAGGQNHDASSALSKYLDESGKMLEKAERLIEANIMRRLLFGQLRDLELEDLSFTGLNFSSGIITALIRITDYGGFFPGAPGEYPYLALFAVKNVTEEMLSEDFKAVVAECDGDIYCLIEADIGQPSRQDSLSEAFERLGTFLDSNLMLKIQAVYDGPGYGPAGISVSAERLRRRMDALVFMCLESEPDPDSYPAIEIDLPQMLSSIYGQIVSCNFDLAYAELKGIVAGAAKSGMNITRLKRFSAAVLFYISEALEQLRQKEVIASDTLSVNLDERKITSISMLDDIIDEVFAALRSRPDSKGEPKGNEVIAFIDENFHLPEFHTGAVTDRFDISPSTLSRIVRRKTGRSPYDYISHLRFERAKELLAQGKSISETTDAVGLYNTLTLLRLFKKFSGMSPSQYKDLL